MKNLNLFQRLRENGRTLRQTRTGSARTHQYMLEICSRYVACMLMVLVLSIGQMWGKNAATSPATATRNSQSFLDVANTYCNAKIKGNDSTLAYSMGYINGKAWYTGGKSNSSFTFTAAVDSGFIASSGTGGANGNGYYTIKSSQTAYIYATGFTRLGVMGSDNSSSKYIVVEVEEYAADGTVSNKVSFSPSSPGTSITVYSKGGFDGTKFYRINFTSNANSNCKLYQVRFTPVPASCSDPTAPTAFANTSVTSTTATMSITDAADAASYDIYCSTSSTAPEGSTTPTATGLTTKTPTITSLTANTTYYAWVRAVCDESHKSSWVALTGSTFTTNPTYSVTYNDNGKTSGSVPTDATAYESGASVTVKDNTGSMAKTGYVFAGWNSKDDGTGTDYAPATTFSISANTTLYAKWIEGTSATMTWTLTTVSGSDESNVDGGTTDIGTSSTTPAENLTTLTDLTGVGVKRTTTGKGGNTGKIETPASYDADKYVSMTFDVASGYEFTPTVVSIKTVAVSTAKDLKFEFTDENGSYSVTKTGLSTNASATTNTLYFTGCTTSFTGTVTVKIYVYGANDAYRLSTPLTITGTVAAAASPLSTTNPSSASYVKGASATALSVTASGGTRPYSYQWYSCDDAVKTNPSTVGTNSASYTPGTTSTGYYYCTVTDAASSSVSSSVATITVRNAYAPTASPAAGTVASGTAITLSSSDGGTIYYTTNGDTPDDESTAYDSEAKPTITTATTIKAVAKVNGYLGSVLTAAYTIKPTPGLAYGTSTVNKTNGDANFTNSLTNPNSVSVTYSSSDGDVATVDSDGEVTIKKYGSATITASFAGDATYLAQDVSYTLNVAKRTYTVTYNAGTGTITGSHSDDTKTEDETLTLPGVTFTQSGYVQTGWATEDRGPKEYNLGGDYTDNAELDLYPVWSEVYAIEEGSISNGSITISPTSAIAGATISLTASASLGYVFDSWTITKTSDESNVTASVSLSGTTSATFTMPAYGVTVTAAFEEVTYTLSYDDGSATDGDVPESPAAGSYAAGTEITVPGNSGSLVKGTDVFRGWTDGTTFYKEGQKFNITGNTTLTAVWDGGLSCTTLAQVAVKSDYTMNDIVGSSVISGFDSKGQSLVGSTTEYANKLGSSGYVRISPKDGSSFAAGDKISIRIYNGKTSTKSINVALLQSDGSTKTELTAKSMDANTATTFEHTLVAAEISATGYVQVMRGESNGDGGWFISATIEHCVKTNFTVSFDMKSHGSAIGSYVGVPTGKKIVAPTAPTATGYTFGGWYTDSDCKTAVDWSTMTITADKTLYAKWTANSYTINYYDEGGSAFSGSHADGYPTSHTYGTGTDLESATKSCYTFGGWYTESDCSSGLVTSLGATDYTDAINLYAKWTLFLNVTADPEDAPATVGKATEIAMTATGASTYQWQVCDDNEGTNATNITGLDTEFSNYDEAILSFTPESADTYYLRCKITDACSNVDYSAVATITATEAYDITMGSYTNGSFTIKVGGDEAVSESTESGAGATIYIAATPSSGYAFKSWEILDGEEDDVTTTVGATSSSTSTSFTMPSYAVTINATFVGTHTLTVSVSGGVGGTVSPTSTTVGETLTQSISATPGTGYTFGSWAVSGTGASLSSTTANPTTFTMGTANATVTATFSAKTYGITLDAGNGTGGSESVTMTYNSASHTSITAPTLTGYSLVGWYTGAGGTGSMVMNASGVLQASVDGYTDGSANWTKDATCTLYAKYAAVYPEGYLYITDVMATPEAKADYTITSSATDADYDADLNGSFSHSGLQHWAKASEKNTGVYTLTFSDALTASATAAGVAVDVWWGSDNGSSNAGTKVYINGTADSDEIGYQKTNSDTRQQLLEGLKNLRVIGTTSVSSLQLKCTDNAGSTWFRVGIKDIPGYLLTYDDGDGSGAPSASYQPNATITLSSTAPTRSGYVFRGWQVGGSGTVYAPGASFSMPAAAVTLVAKWDGVCMNFAAATSGSSETPAGTAKEISTATGGYASALSGGSMTFLGRVGVIGNNDTYGLVFDSKDDEILTVTLTDAMLEAGAIIVLDCYSLKNSTTGKEVGFTISGNACAEGNYITTANAYQRFTRTYVVTEDDGIDGTSTFTIEGATTDKVYLKGMTVAGCTSCTSITPTITGATTLYTYPSVTSTTLTLAKDGSTGGVTWSVTPASGVVTLSGSGTTVTVTAVATGTATITASIDPDGEHCGASVSQEISVAGCNILPIASVVLTSNTTADEVNATAVISGLSGAKKLNDDGAKFGMTLSGDSPFKEGDIINITGTMDESPTSTTFAVYSSETASSSSLIYTTTLSANAAINVEIEVTGDILTALNTSKKVAVIRTKNPTDGQYNQNPHMTGMYLKRYSCSEGLAEFTGDGDDALWSNTENWAGGKVPTIDDRIVINKPMTVDVDDAQAAEIILDQSSSNTGKLTIGAGQALVVAGTIKKWNGSEFVPTTAADLAIGSSAEGNGTLIFQNDGNAATVQMYSKAYTNESTTWNWQYMGIPYVSAEPLYNYYNSYIYQWTIDATDASKDGWSPIYSRDVLLPWVGYCITNSTANTTYVMESGECELVATTDKELTIPAGENREVVFANPWTAPIHIPSIDPTDFGGSEATVYLFNTGLDSTKTGGTAGTESEETRYAAGTYLTLPVNTASTIGNPFISSMQGFIVKNTNAGGAETILTLRYNTVVRPTGVRSVVGGPMHAPTLRGVNNAEPTVLKLMARGSHYDDCLYLLEREDFTRGFDNGWDGTKMGNSNVAPQITALNENGNRDAVSAVPDLDGTVVNFRAGEDSEYTIHFSYDGSDVLYLNDMLTETSTRIAEGSSYTFATSQSDEPNRFVISHTPFVKTTPTGADNVQGDERQSVRKLFYQGVMYIIRGGRIYNAEGARIQ